jgi:hypothetical protein
VARSTARRLPGAFHDRRLLESLPGPRHRDAHVSRVRFHHRLPARQQGFLHLCVSVRRCLRTRRPALTG